jgi:hypothetical protein
MTSEQKVEYYGNLIKNAPPGTSHYQIENWQSALSRAYDIVEFKRKGEWKGNPDD